MSAPRRWIDEGGSATPFERDLLRSALSVEPPPDAQKQVWTAVLSKLPAAAAVGAASGAAIALKGGGGAAKIAVATKIGAGAGVGSASGATVVGAAGAGLVKSALIGACSAVAVLATYSVVAPPDRTEAPTPAVVTAALPAPQPKKPGRAFVHTPEAVPAPAPVPAEAPSAAPAERRASADPRPATSAGGGPAGGLGGAAPVAPAVPPGAEERVTMIREESQRVADARDALRRGDAPGALTQLQQIQARFPDGVLGQEREALTIEALARSGRRAEASARAAAFLQAHPTSVLAGRVQPFVQ